MNVLLVTLVLGAACVLDVHGGSADNAAKLAEAAENKKHCIETTGVKPESIAEINKKHFDNPPNELVKFVKCYFEKAGAANADGSLNLEIAVGILPPDVDVGVGRSVLESCKDKKAGTPEDTSYEIFRCFHGNPQINTAHPLL